MLKFQWNALRRGDAVFVHDASEPDLAQQPGVGLGPEIGRGR